MAALRSIRGGHRVRRSALRRHRDRYGGRRRHVRPPHRSFRQAGPVARTRGYLPRERDNWDSTAVFVKGKYRAPEFWLDRHGHEFPPEVNYYVGGNTKFYGAALFRLRPQDFGELRHHGGNSPAWPIEYADLEPYYTQAEHLYVVHGRTARTRPGSRQRRLPVSAGAARTADPAAQRRPREAGPAPVPPADRRAADAGRARGGDPDSVCIRCDRVDGSPACWAARPTPR